MYSTRNATFGILSDILAQLDEYTIYAYYMGEFVIGRLYNSPLRTDDKIPSFAVFKGRRGNLMFKDHGSGLSGNVLTFVRELKHIKTDGELEKELLRILRFTAPKSTRNVKREYHSNASAEIGIVRQDWTETDKKYWSQFGISMTTLNQYQVFSIKYYLCNKAVAGIYSDESPMYAYKVNSRFKIYRPLASKYTKWRTNLTNSDIQGLAQLPEGHRKLLIITKSLKDVMVLHEMGFDAVSPASETTFIPNEILETLKAKYDNVFILYDRDKTGMMRAREYSKKYTIPAFFVNKRFNAKDLSDAVRDNGFDTVNEWLTKTLQKYV